MPTVHLASLAVLTAFLGDAAAQPAGETGTGAPGTPVATSEAAPTETTEEKPVSVRLRQLEQRVQALKERAWRAKARVGILKEDALGGGVGAQTSLVHKNKMGGSLRLTKLVYAIDGAQVFARADEAAETLYKTKAFDILNGPIAPGSHTVSIVATYRGHGYGVFKYLEKYSFTSPLSYTFTVDEGKTIRVDCEGYEKGGPNTKLEDRPALKCTTVDVKGK
jgi:hypothetical protein